MGNSPKKRQPVAAGGHGPIASPSRLGISSTATCAKAYAKETLQTKIIEATLRSCNSLQKWADRTFPQGNRLAYIFKPATADLATLALIGFAMWPTFGMPVIPCLILLTAMAHVGATCLGHYTNMQRLGAQEDLVSAAAATKALFLAKQEKLQAVVAEVSQLRADVEQKERAAEQMTSLQAKAEGLQKKLDYMQRMQQRITEGEKRLGALPRMQQRMLMLQRRRNLLGRIKWAVQVLKAETANAKEVQAEYAQLKAERAAMQTARRELQQLRVEAEEAQALAARRAELQQRASQVRALRVEVAALEKETAELPALETLARELGRMKDRSHALKENILSAQLQRLSSVDVSLSRGAAPTNSANSRGTTEASTDQVTGYVSAMGGPTPCGASVWSGAVSGAAAPFSKAMGGNMCSGNGTKEMANPLFGCVTPAPERENKENGTRSISAAAAAAAAAKQGPASAAASSVGGTGAVAGSKPAPPAPAPASSASVASSAAAPVAGGVDGPASSAAHTGSVTVGVGCAGHGADSRRVTGLTCTSTLSAGTDSVISTTGPIGPAHSQHTAQGSQAVVLDTPDGGSHMFGMVCDNEAFYTPVPVEPFTPGPEAAALAAALQAGMPLAPSRSVTSVRSGAVAGAPTASAAVSSAAGGAVPAPSITMGAGASTTSFGLAMPPCMEDEDDARHPEKWDGEYECVYDESEPSFAGAAAQGAGMPAGVDMAPGSAMSMAAMGLKRLGSKLPARPVLELQSPGQSLGSVGSVNLFGGTGVNGHAGPITGGSAGATPISIM